MPARNNNKTSNRGLASADEKTRERVARAGGEARARQRRQESSEKKRGNSRSRSSRR